ncbi:hypothetical protein ACR1PO_15840 [Chryseobacterium sp. RRHN12]|uniref:hypothetical protein n=1 Tax=Chryseobacterium sp. RRHN12 TaxID=3437884 RepID=UPI003D9AFE47
MAKKQQNIRMNADTKAILEIICKKRDHSQAQVIEEALKNEAKKEKITKKQIEDYKNENPI